VADLLRTRFSELVGIEVPIIQAPIGQVSSPKLVAAVSNAGGLGSLSGTWRTTEELRRLIQEIQSLTKKPFAVNLVLEWPQHERLQVCAELGVPILSFFWGDPSPYLDDVHSSGALVLQTVGSADDAKLQVDRGVDAVVAQGWESGGHIWGQVATLPLIPAVVDAVTPIPVIAAGGIADGRGFAAALALGADGIWIGTRFIASVESTAHPTYKDAVLQASEAQTAYTTLFENDEGWSDAHHRVLRNSTYQNWEDAGAPPRGSRPGEGGQVATLADGTRVHRYADWEPTADTSGDVESLALYAGQSAGLVHTIKPAADIVRELVDDAQRHLARSQNLFSPDPS